MAAPRRALAADSPSATGTAASAATAAATRTTAWPGGASASSVSASSAASTGPAAGHSSAVARTAPTSALAIWTALIALYLIWGSTYLGIRIAVGSIPPFVMAGVRFLIAGLALYAWESWRTGSIPRPSPREWRDSAIVGGGLLGGGMGMVAFGEQTVASGFAALLVAAMPVWLAVFGWLIFRERLPRLVLAGIVIGIAGVALLVWPTTGASLDTAGVIALLISPMFWALGSLYSTHRAKLPARPLVATAAQMFAGGAILLVAAAITGEFSQLNVGQVSGDSLAALAYLVVIGSLVGFTCYVWLLRVAPLSMISTYAYVNPVVAFMLGAVILSEPITMRTVIASAVIVVAVALIVTGRSAAGHGPVRSGDDARAAPIPPAECQ
jgi:drug/metabolite transporter (DMT)-like permease